MRHVDLIAGLRQQRVQGLRDSGFIVDDENAAWHEYDLPGRVGDWLRLYRRTAWLESLTQPQGILIHFESLLRVFLLSVLSMINALNQGSKQATLVPGD